jgi:hypothetical protein
MGLWVYRSDSPGYGGDCHGVFTTREKALAALKTAGRGYVKCFVPDRLWQFYKEETISYWDIESGEIKS